ncbi:MAG: NAD(P)-dependent oxidoreductase [Sedimentitalea sp.]|uniref:NAD-dependent epimerase/dehydratase family protein n=1 Tax=Sedimentitalea sp. TaxID=2048915 RepID=UPI0032663FCC
MAGMKILVTGANGFIGRHVVDAARADGHEVCALVRDRSKVPDGWKADSDITTAELDLTAPDAQDRLAKLLAEAEAIIHAAAIMGGDAARQINDTVKATETVLAALKTCNPPPRMVLVSSLSVYDGQALKTGAVLTEASPLEATPTARDAYCEAKLAQEAHVRAAANAQGFELWILRPGAVFGPGRLWNGHLGHPLGPVLLQMESKGEVPVSFVEHTAKALVLAATTPAEGIEVVNVMDDDRPDRATYVAALRRGGWPRVTLPSNWRFLSAVGGLVHGIPRLGRKLPGLLRPAVLHARMKPLRFDNARLHARLNVPPQPPFAQIMSMMLEREKGHVS